MKFSIIRKTVTVLLAVIIIAAGVPCFTVSAEPDMNGDKPCWIGGNPVCNHRVTFYAWTKDGSSHFLMCAECYAFQEQSEHVMIENGYIDEEGHCTRCCVCGFVDRSTKTQHEFTSYRPGFMTHEASCSICGSVALKHDFKHTHTWDDGTKSYYCKTCRTTYSCDPKYNTLKKAHVPTTAKASRHAEDRIKYKLSAKKDAAYMLFYCWSDNGKVLSEELFDFTDGKKEEKGELFIPPELEGHTLYWEVLCMKGLGFPEPEEGTDGPAFDYNATSVANGSIRVLNKVADRSTWEEYAARSIVADGMTCTASEVSYDEFDDCTMITTELSFDLEYIPKCEVYYLFYLDYKAAPGTVNYSNKGKMNTIITPDPKLGGHTVERNAIALKKGQNLSGYIVAVIVAYPTNEVTSTYMTELDPEQFDLPKVDWLMINGKKEKFPVQIPGDTVSVDVIKWRIETGEQKIPEEALYSLPYSIEQNPDSAQTFGESLISLNENMEKNGNGFDIEKSDLLSYCARLTEETGRTATPDNVILVADCQTEFTVKENETPSTEFTEYLLNITPEFEYRLMLRDDMNKKNAPYITVTNRQELDCTIPIWMRVVLPADFAPHGAEVTVRHRGYEYRGTVANDGEYCYLGFENPDGFSDFLFIGGVPDDHTETELVNAVSPSCDTDGYSGDEVCSICGIVVKQGSVIPADGHAYDEKGVCVSCGKTDPQKASDSGSDTVDPDAGSDTADPDTDSGTETPPVKIIVTAAIITAVSAGAAVGIILAVKKKKGR